RSSPRGRHSRSRWRARARSRPRARRSARRTRRTRRLARSAATSRSRCRTTSCTARTRRSRPSASWLSGSVAEKDYVALNRAGWTKSNEQYTDRAAHGAWAQEEITWGQWGKPEREVQVLPELAGKDVIELGCGTAYFGAWLKRAGARRVVGVDVTPAQLETARRMDDEDWEGVEFHPSTSDMLRILRENGFQLLDFRELFAPDDAKDHEWYDDPPAEWAKQWPAEEIWRLRLQRP